MTSQAAVFSKRKRCRILQEIYLNRSVAAISPIHKHIVEQVQSAAALNQVSRIWSRALTGAINAPQQLPLGLFSCTQDEAQQARGVCVSAVNPNPACLCIVLALCKQRRMSAGKYHHICCLRLSSLRHVP